MENVLEELRLDRWWMNECEEFLCFMRSADRRLTDDMLPYDPTESDAVRLIMAMIDSDGYYRCIRRGDEFVGHASISALNSPSERTGRLRLILYPHWCGRGVGTWAARQLLDLAFRPDDPWTRQFERVQAAVIGDNPAAVRVLEKCGFEYEGATRHSVLRDGIYYDEHHYALLAPPMPSEPHIFSKEDKTYFGYIR